LSVSDYISLFFSAAGLMGRFSASVDLQAGGEANNLSIRVAYTNSAVKTLWYQPIVEFQKR
jgi:hypothetical protein